MNYSSGRELCQTLVCFAPEPWQHLCTVPCCCKSRDVLQGTSKSLCYSLSEFMVLRTKKTKVCISALQRCMYASCNCERSEDCLCSVFSSYTRACSSKGIFLLGWRDRVCRKDFFCSFPWVDWLWSGQTTIVAVSLRTTDRYVDSCPETQVYSYKLQRCQQTCMSLSSVANSCSMDFLPVDGCTCPEGFYLNDHDLCVPVTKCPCFHNEVFIKPGKSINIKDEHWWVEGRCLWPQIYLSLVPPWHPVA